MYIAYVQMCVIEKNVEAFFFFLMKVSNKGSQIE